MLNVALNSQIENKGLRRQSEISNLVNQSIEVKRQNPSVEYEIFHEEGEVSQGKVF